ncbi:MAG TPA: MoaD/ThiS family protein [Dehalococcoidia bacterium]|nr:MoaD/ThiS family protein [Dehalococcoidia bacterium]
MIEVPAGTFDQVLRAVDDECSGFRDRLLENGELRPELAVAIDGEMVPLALHEPISDGSELAVVPAIGGG